MGRPSRRTAFRAAALALALVAARPAGGAEPEAVSAAARTARPPRRCDHHPLREEGLIEKVIAARRGYYAFSHGKEIAAAPDIGGAACASEPMVPDAVGAITRNGTQHCSGILVAPMVVVTAAHCVHLFDASQLDFRVGPDGAQPADFAPAYRAFEHPEYDAGRLGVNDVAIMYLKRPLHGVKPLELRKAPYGAAPGDQLHFVAYGNPGSVLPGKKRCLNLPVSNVCAGSFDYGAVDRHPCRGDSGGAALEHDGQGWRLAGITSWGTENCDALGISMDVGHYRRFIEKGISEAPSRGLPAEILRWSSVATLAAGAVLGTHSLLQYREQGRLHDKAVAMINPDGSLTTDARTYTRTLASADAAGSAGRRAGLEAAAAVALTGALAYLSYWHTGLVGPFRF